MPSPLKEELLKSFQPKQIIDLRDSAWVDFPLDKNISQELINQVENIKDQFEEIIFIDDGYLLIQQPKSTSHLGIVNYALVNDHVNLTNLNPFLGNQSRSIRFYAVNELYKYKLSCFQIIGDAVKVAGINPGSIPKEKEIDILEKSGIEFYCYKLVVASLIAGYFDMKVIGILET